MDRWDKDERHKKQRQERTEKIGRFLFTGAISVLVIYVFTLVLESYSLKCGTC